MLATVSVICEAVAPAAAEPSAAATVRLTGAGSTFDAPFFSAAFSRYEKLNPGVTVSYAAVGSSQGIDQLSSGVIDFGASDVPMDATQEAHASRGRVVQVPVDLGAVVVSYNLRETPLLEPLRLTGAVLARIYLGQITNWDDPAITSLNPADELPNEKITVVHRSDGSGTTYIFTNYLSTISPQWAGGPGTGTSVKWPVGVGAKRSAGVAAVVQAKPGSIGYFELSYAEANSLAYCLVQNAAGAFVGPMTGDVAAAAAAKTDVSAANFSIVNEPGPDSYPISGYSWVLLYAKQTNTTIGSAVVELVDYLTHAGQVIAGANFYVPLPPNVASLAQSTLETVVGPAGQKLLTGT